jgi:hypothetical protein
MHQSPIEWNGSTREVNRSRPEACNPFHADQDEKLGSLYGCASIVMGGRENAHVAFTMQRCIRRILCLDSKSLTCWKEGYIFIIGVHLTPTGRLINL